jgi:hypothetical protein
LLVPVVLAGYLMIIIDTSVVVTALPQIQQTLSLSAATLALDAERLHDRLRRPAAPRRARLYALPGWGILVIRCEENSAIARTAASVGVGGPHPQPTRQHRLRSGKNNAVVKWQITLLLGAAGEEHQPSSVARK